MHEPSLTPLAAAALRVPVPERALVIGSGDGEGVLFLAREFPSARVRGVDRSGEAVRRATARVGLDPEGRVAFKQGSPRSLPYPGEMFDLVVQVRGPLWIAEAIRVLRPGGHLICVECAGRPLRPWPRSLAGGLARRGFEQLPPEERSEDRHAAYVGRFRAPGGPGRE